MNENAASWLRAYLLLHGPAETGEIKKAAADLGYTRGMLREAKRELGVITTNNWAPDHPADTWFWTLPAEDAK